jgi:hypothetical protein
VLLWEKRSPKLQRNSEKKGISDFASFPKRNATPRGANQNAVKSIKKAKASGVSVVPVSTCSRNFKTKQSYSA